ncbi:MAG: cupin [Sphingobium sp.]
MPHLPTTPLHLGPAATATVEPDFPAPHLDPTPWYEAYTARHAADAAQGHLVSQYNFTQSWTSWEVHPAGSEVVICTAGRITLHQQAPAEDGAPGPITTLTLAPGDYAINPPGAWHTADIAPGESATCIFLTPGEGTDHRPR